MTNKDLIDELVDSLEPKPARPTGALATGWWLLAMAVTITGMAITDPFRHGFEDQLLSAPRFALETIIALVVSAVLMRAAFELAVPDARRQRLHVCVAASVGVLWLGLFAITFVAPVLEPSMLGKRETCYLEVMYYGIPLTLICIALQRRLYVLSPLRSGFLAGIASGAIPGLLMQLACMHEPWHIATHHLAPIAVTAGVGAGLGWLLLRNHPR